MNHDHPSFSFTQSVDARGHDLKTEIIQVSLRLPIDDVDHPFCVVEHEARKALGLGEDAKFIVIERVRLIEGNPSAFHRAYLNPSRFPREFLEHDFAAVSLIDLYHQYGEKLGFRVEARDTVLSARVANLYETNLLLQRYRSQSTRRVVLDAQQCLYARDLSTQNLFVLEYLQASYFENWKYEIKNRPA